MASLKLGRCTQYLESGSASSPAAKAKLQFATEARQEQKGKKPGPKGSK